MKKVAAAGMLVALLIGAGATAASATSAAPSYRQPGVRIWHDDNGWHVRVTHNTIHDRVFTGEIVTRGGIVDAHPVRLEHNDFVRVGVQQHALLFHFNNYGGVDGVDFNIESALVVWFRFVSDGRVVPPSYISIGPNGTHPAHDPSSSSSDPLLPGGPSGNMGRREDG